MKVKRRLGCAAARNKMTWSNWLNVRVDGLKAFVVSDRRTLSGDCGTPGSLVARTRNQRKLRLFEQQIPRIAV
jgi:hypothetical protein